MARRPVSRIEINLNDIESSIQRIETLCQNTNIRPKIKDLSKHLNEFFSETENSYSQTNEVDIDLVSQFLQQLSDNDLLFTMKSIWETLSGSEKLVILHEFFGSLDVNEQIHFFSMLGDLFNKSLNETGLEISHKLKEMSMDELSEKGSK